MGFSINQLVIFAVRAGDLSLLRERVDAGGDINHFDPEYGSALAAAVRKGNLDILDWLISNGADVSVDYHDALGALEIALRNPVPDVVYRLVCAGAKLKRKARPYYRERLEQCLAEVSAAGKTKK